METVTLSLQVLAGLAFLGYGIACLGFGAMEAEFARYGLSQYRRTVGFFEVLGGSGLLLGLGYEPFGFLAALGLAVLMALGVGVRWRVGDRWWQMIPAAALGVIAMYLFVQLSPKG